LLAPLQSELQLVLLLEPLALQEVLPAVLQELVQMILVLHEPVEVCTVLECACAVHQSCYQVDTWRKST
jgi:hypothetical protein